MKSGLAPHYFSSLSQKINMFLRGFLKYENGSVSIFETLFFNCLLRNISLEQKKHKKQSNIFFWESIF